MLTANELRRVAARSGARDLGKVEIDVVLTFLLQMFHERGVLEHLAFKGGTMLRKTVFGARGRLSTDLDFTLHSHLSRDDFTLALIGAFETPYRGLSFDIGNRKSWYLGEQGCGATPIVRHEDNPSGIAVRLEVSMRERPVLPVARRIQLPQEYSDFLGFTPVEVPCLAFEEVLSEKLRAASQRAKIRDLHDLAESLSESFDRQSVRRLAVLKLWNQGGTLDYHHIVDRMQSADYDAAELTALLRKDQRADLKSLIERIANGYRFLTGLSELERSLVADLNGHRTDLADSLIRVLTAPP